MSCTMREMTLDDITRVFEIETKAHVAPWTKSILRDCLRVGYDCFVILKRKKIQGFAIARLTPDECHLLNICIAPRMQGKGLGDKLLLHLLDWAKQKSKTMLLEVRPSNYAAINMYEKFHFKQIAYRKKYYQNPDGTSEDAIILALSM